MADGRRATRVSDSHAQDLTRQRRADAILSTAAIRFAACTGLRLGELRALRWRDVVWADSLVHVRLNAPSSAPAGSAERRPKLQVVRSVPLADEAAKAIEGLSRREFHTSPNDYVFPSPTGSIIDGKRLRDALYRALESAGLDRCCSSKAGRAIRGVAIERCLGGSFAGSRLVKDPVIRKAAFRFQCPRCARCA